MAEYFEAGIFNLLDKNTDTYHQMLAIKGDKGDPGPVASEEVIRRITSEEVAKVVAEAPEDFDTLKEISDWINTHKDDASAMNSAILANTNDIETNASNIAQNLSFIQGLQDDRDDINDTIDNTILPKLAKTLEIVSFDASTGELVTRTMT